MFVTVDKDKEENQCPVYDKENYICEKYQTICIFHFHRTQYNTRSQNLNFFQLGSITNLSEVLLFVFLITKTGPTLQCHLHVN